MKEEVEGEYGGSPIRLDMMRVKLAKEVKKNERRIEEIVSLVGCSYAVYSYTILLLKCFRKEMKLGWQGRWR